MNHFSIIRPSSLLQFPRNLSQNSTTPSSARIPVARKLKIVEMGGFHATLLPVMKNGELIGGAAYIADAVTKIRQKSDPILISNGDIFTGQASSLKNGGDYVINFMNNLKFDCMTLGIHDFDEGQQILSDRIKKLKFPVIAANLNTVENMHVSQSENTVLNCVQPYAILERGMQTLAIMGFLKEDTPIFQSAENIKNLKFMNPKDAIFHWMDEILDWNPNVIIVQYNNLSEAEEFAQIINDFIRNSKKIIDKLHYPSLIFIGGHLETKPIQKENYLIMQGTDRGYKLGIIKISDSLHKPRFHTEYAIINAKQYEPESKISALVDSFAQKIKERDELLGETKAPLQRHRYHDCTLGILATESMRKITDSEISFLSSGTLKIDIPAGPIYSFSLDNSIPFKDTIYKILITGKQILDILEQSAKLEADSGGSGGKILQAAGLKFTYSMSAEKGKRISNALINGQQIEQEKIYTAAIGKYLFEGGDGYSQFRQTIKIDEKSDLKEAIKMYIREKKILDIARDYRIQEIP